MTTFNQNISNTVRTFGGGGASLWNAYSWGSFNWGEGTLDFVQRITKYVTNSESPDSGFSIKNVTHYLASQDMPLTDLFAKQPTLGVSNSLSLTSDMTTENILDENGWDKVFVSEVINAENRSTASWANVASSASGWVQQTVASTTWS